jgi:hypothetical protein
MKTRTKKMKIFVFAALGLLVLAASAGAVKKVEKVHLRAGDIVIDGYGGFKPETLPKNKNAPITIYGGGKISTVSGDLPPILDELNFEFDKHGAVETRGLDVCTQGKLVATDVPASRRACGGAIIGKGFGSAIVKFPEQAPIPASSPLTFFNGPKKHGNDTLLIHGHLDVPAPTTYIVPVEIKRIHKGVYGYRVEVDIPVLAGGSGIPISGRATIGKKWTFKGKTYSYVNARCQTGRLQARGEFAFTDGTLLKGSFLRPCKVRG